jgi:ketosteroid isomerase-like protein
LTVDEWIESYRRAWIEADSDLVSTLFADDGVYRWNVLEPAAVGRAAIKQYWDGETAKQSEVDVVFGTPFVDGPGRVAVEFWTRMRYDGEPVTLPGCMLLRFDEDGRCQELREYWFVVDGDHATSDGWGK